MEDGDHGVVTYENMIRKVEVWEVLLTSLRNIFTLNAGAWDTLSRPHGVIASTHHVHGGRLIVTRLRRRTCLLQLGLRRTSNGHEGLRGVQVTGAIRSPVLLKIPPLGVETTLSHIDRCE